jgi:outer membrane protein TolC
VLAPLALAVSLWAAPSAQAAKNQTRCIDPRAALQAPGAGEDNAGPRIALQQMVRDALLRNNGIGAARLMAEAAQSDLREAMALKGPQAVVTGSVDPSFDHDSDDGNTSMANARAGITLSQVIYDGGRSDRMVGWRRHQAEATRLGLLSQQEQLALATVSMAFERSRWRTQSLIYDQYVRKMGCLVDALEVVVKADRGRASELVQARKQVQQAELQLTQAESQARLVEARLRRMVGDGLPSTDGMSAVLLEVPELSDMLSRAEQGNDIAAMAASAQAMHELARAMEAGTRPQVSWSVSGSARVGAGSSGGSNGAAMSAGVNLSIPLMNPAADFTVQAAHKRSQAAQLQREEALESRRLRIVEVHEQATAAFDRLERIGRVLQDSERLRGFTLLQWKQLGRRSLFDVMSAEGDHYNLRVQYVNALHDGEQLIAMLRSLGGGLSQWLE